MTTIDLKPQDEISLRPTQIGALVNLYNELLVDDPCPRSYHNLRATAIDLLREFSDDVKRAGIDLEVGE